MSVVASRDFATLSTLAAKSSLLDIESIRKSLRDFIERSLSLYPEHRGSPSAEQITLSGQSILKLADRALSVQERRILRSLILQFKTAAGARDVLRLIRPGETRPKGLRTYRKECGEGRRKQELLIVPVGRRATTKGSNGHSLPFLACLVHLLRRDELAVRINTKELAGEDVLVMEL